MEVALCNKKAFEASNLWSQIFDCQNSQCLRFLHVKIECERRRIYFNELHFAAAVFSEIWVAQIFKKKYQRQIVGSKMLQCIFHCIKQVEKAVEFIMEHCLKVHLIEVGYISVLSLKKVSAFVLISITYWTQRFMKSVS